MTAARDQIFDASDFENMQIHICQETGNENFILYPCNDMTGARCLCASVYVSFNGNETFKLIIAKST